MQKTTEQKAQSSSETEIIEVPDDILFFSEKLVQKAGLGALPSDFKEVYVSKLAYQVVRRVSLTVMLHADRKKVDSISKKVESKELQPQDAYKMLKSEVDDFDNVVINALKEFEREFIVSVKSNL